MALIYQISNEIENILIMNFGQGEKFQPVDGKYPQLFDALHTFWSSFIENHSFFKDKDDLVKSIHRSMLIKARNESARV